MVRAIGVYSLRLDQRFLIRCPAVGRAAGRVAARHHAEPAALSAVRHARGAGLATATLSIVRPRPRRRTGRCL